MPPVKLQWNPYSFSGLPTLTAYPSISIFNQKSVTQANILCKARVEWLRWGDGLGLPALGWRLDQALMLRVLWGPAQTEKIRSKFHSKDYSQTSLPTQDFKHRTVIWLMKNSGPSYDEKRNAETKARPRITSALFPVIAVLQDHSHFIERFSYIVLNFGQIFRSRKHMFIHFSSRKQEGWALQLTMPGICC